MSTYFQNHISKLRQFFCARYLAVALFSPGSVAISYVLPVYWTTSYLHTLRSYGAGDATVAQSDSPRGSTDFTPYRILKLTRQGVAPLRVESDMSTTALFFSHHIACRCIVQKLLSSDVNVFVRHAMNGITRRTFNIGKIAKL